MKIDKKVVNKIVELGKLVLRFGKVYRITRYEDGKTPESDTDHTVMLSLICCSVAHKYNKKLNLGLVAQFALVHDLLEAYTGDIPNIHDKVIDKRQYIKKKLEDKALKKLKKNFGMEFPWLSKTIEKYEKFDTKEARFVKVMDKAMPKVTHSMNNAKVLRFHGYNKKTVKEMLDRQRKSIEGSYGKDQKEAVKILEFLTERIISRF